MSPIKSRAIYGVINGRLRVARGGGVGGVVGGAAPGSARVMGAITGAPGVLREDSPALTQYGGVSCRCTHNQRGISVHPGYGVYSQVPLLLFSGNSRTGSLKVCRVGRVPRVSEPSDSQGLLGDLPATPVAF